VGHEQLIAVIVLGEAGRGTMKVNWSRVQATASASRPQHRVHSAQGTRKYRHAQAPFSSFSRIQLRRGAVAFPSLGHHLQLGDSVQTILTLLGGPQHIYTKAVDVMRIHNASSATGSRGSWASKEEERKGGKGSTHF